VLLVNAEGDTEGQARINAFRTALEDFGWIEGRNLEIHYRWQAADTARAAAFANELVSLAPDAILANGTPAVVALRQATATIPIIFVVVTDPVGAGYVPNRARPGGNLTGFSTFEPEIGGKWLGLLKEVDPRLRRVACILDPGFSGFAAVREGIRDAAPTFGIALSDVVFRKAADDIASSLAAFAQQPRGGLIVLPTAINNSERDRIIASAARLRLPAVYPFPLYAASGGLMSYGIDSVDLFRRSASYVDRILNGQNPAELPVQAPLKFELVVNLKTAAALGLTVPHSLLVRADKIIE
jgi:putative ABC transport system substrate-binding protein